MNPALQQLKDIHLPKAISQWLIAPGWLALYSIGLIISIFLCYYLYKRHQKRYTVKYALARLTQLQQQAEKKNQVDIAAEISTLIRRTALYYFHRDAIAGLTGGAWLDFLNQSVNTTLFTQEIGILITDVPYQKNTKKNLEPLFKSTRSWLITIGKKQPC